MTRSTPLPIAPPTFRCPSDLGGSATTETSGYPLTLPFESCVISSFAGQGQKKGCPGVCSRGAYALRDRRDESFPVVTDQYCRNHILNSRDLDMAPYYKDLRRAGIAAIRIEGRGRNPQWIGQQVSRYRRLCDGTETMLLGKEDQTVTRGHFFHGIL